MQEYNIMPPEMLKKKLSLKEHSKNTIARLRQVNLKETFGENYISDTGITQFDFEDLLNKLETCGNESTYKATESVDEWGEITDNIKIVETSACHQYSICPICASVKRNQTANAIKPYLTVIKRMPGLHLYMATITIKGTDNAGNDYDRLRKAWTKFKKLGQRRQNGKRSQGETSKILGDILSIEIVPEITSSNYHVHGHILMVTNEPLDYTVYDQDIKRKLELQYGTGNIPDNEMEIAVKKRINISDSEIENNVAVSKISEEWHKVSGGINIHVAPIRERIINGDHKTIENQIYEIIKYETKPWEMDPVKLLEVWQSIKGKRRLTKSGIFTNNQNSANDWLSLLQLHGLSTLWNELNPEQVPDNTELDAEEQYRTIKIKYSDKLSCYEQDITDCDLSYLDLPEYKIYQRNRIFIINDYRQRIKTHFDNFKIAHLFGILDNQARYEWIREKEFIKADMRSKINEITDQLRHEMRMANKIKSTVTTKIEKFKEQNCEILTMLEQLQV